MGVERMELPELPLSDTQKLKEAIAELHEKEAKRDPKFKPKHDFREERKPSQ